MSIKETLLNLFMTKNPDDYSDEEVKQVLHSVTDDNLIPYQNYHANQVIKFSIVNEFKTQKNTKKHRIML